MPFLWRPVLRFFSQCSFAVLTISSIGFAEDPKATDSSASAAVKQGHSFHGQVFNEGPRQAAYVMPGLAKIKFPVTTASPLAQQFVQQGVSQLHGFWYWEAERSFRQAAAIDPQCAIAYWGMAMANAENQERARGFIRKAKERDANVSDRENRYINSIVRYLGVDKKEGEKDLRSGQDRARDLIRDYEQIALTYPDDIEAKAFLCFQLWHAAREGLPIASHLSIDALLGEIFAVDPMHPAHHYRIHLWDGQKPEKALESAAKGGPSSPAIAHMWHMPGHTYSELRRYRDAVYQQEASARVDHAYMMRDRVMPDQIHNFAHNNEWLIRNLLAIGRVHDAIELAKNMVSLPRHPKYNMEDGRGSTSYGRDRLFDALLQYRLWDQLIAMKDSIYLRPSQRDESRRQYLSAMAIAGFAAGKPEFSIEFLQPLESELQQAESELAKLSESPPAPPEWEPQTETEKKYREEFKQAESKLASSRQSQDERVKQLRRAVTSVHAHRAAHQGNFKEAVELAEKNDQFDKGLLSEWLAAAGSADLSVTKINEYVDANKEEVLPLALRAWLFWQAGRKEEAKIDFEKLRTLACDSSLDLQVLARLAPIAKELGYPEQWLLQPTPSSDLGERPDLSTLGPLRWSPYTAPAWVLPSASGTVTSLEQYRGRPVLVVFYLGFGCLHCVEQLHAIEAKHQAFQDAGIQVLAISTESMKSLTGAVAGLSKPLSFPLHADPQLRIFREYHCFDDFEQQPLHGAFLIAPDGSVIWQDISYEPFMQIDFLLEESSRQLKIQETRKSGGQQLARD